jgi:hypothetical protein
MTCCLGNVLLVVSSAAATMHLQANTAHRPQPANRASILLNDHLSSPRLAASTAGSHNPRSRSSVRLGTLRKLRFVPVGCGLPTKALTRSRGHLALVAIEKERMDSLDSKQSFEQSSFDSETAFVLVFFFRQRHGIVRGKDGSFEPSQPPPRPPKSP